MTYREFTEIAAKFSKEHKEDGIIIISVQPRDAEGMADGENGEYGKGSIVCGTRTEFIAEIAMLAEQTGIGCKDLGFLLMGIGFDEGASQAAKNLAELNEKAAMREMTKEEKADFLIEKLKRNMRKS